jgi:hypothetical protein
MKTFYKIDVMEILQDWAFLDALEYIATVGWKPNKFDYINGIFTIRIENQINASIASRSYFLHDFQLNPFTVFLFIIQLTKLIQSSQKFLTKSPFPK